MVIFHQNVVFQGNFKKEIHLFLTHKFRSKNEMGALVLNEMKFQINSDVTLIERFEKISK